MRFALALLAAALTVAAQAQEGPPPVSFQRDVLPLLRTRCSGCHQPAKAKGDLDLTTHLGIVALKDGEAAVVPGKPDESLLIDLVSPFEDEAPEMPKDDDPLSGAEVDLLRRWVAEGAVDDTPLGVSVSYSQQQPPAYSRPPVVTCLEYSPNGEQLAVSGWHEVLLHSVADGEIQARLVGASERIESLAYSPDGASLAVTGGNPGLGGEIQVWDVAKHELKLSVPLTYDTLHGLSWSPDGTRVAFGGTDNTLRAIDVKSGEQVLFQGAHEDWVLDTTWSTDASHLISVSRDRSMKLIKVDTQQFIDNITSITPGALKGGLMSVSCHPSRDELLVGGSDGIPKIYRMYREKKRVIGDDYNLIRALPALPGRVYSVAWSPDGEHTAAASSLRGEGQVRVSKATDGTALWSRDLPSGIYSVAFHPGGQELATAGFDGMVRVYHAATGEPKQEFCAVPLASAHAGQQELTSPALEASSENAQQDAGEAAAAPTDPTGEPENKGQQG